MAARIGGLVIALALVALIALVVQDFSHRQTVVLPSVHVSAEAASAQPGKSATALQVLDARTELLQDRTSAMPNGIPPLARGNENLDTRGAGVADAPKLVRSWRAQEANDAAILQSQRDVYGQTSVPYAEMNVLSQPEGRTWRSQHNGGIRYGGGWLVFGVGLVLALFLAGRGRIRIAEGWSAETIQRFTALERANHWMTATAFVMMALTGAVVLYGRPLLLPFIGAANLGAAASWSAWLHMAFAVPFVTGVLVMIGLWLRENLLTALDWQWLKRGGGFLDDSPDKPPALRFNAGQKLVFWGVVLGGLATLTSGLVLMTPFLFLGYDGMQWAQLLHAAIGLAMIALIIGHIYIGTVGMEGAIDAMWSGQVDTNWAREHHRLWFTRQLDAGLALIRKRR